jgi:hypothetical protein
MSFIYTWRYILVLILANNLCGAEEVIRGIVSGDGVGEMGDGKIV